jgi:hypothetical protein
MAYQKPMKEKPMKGPVSAAASLQGYLIIAVGPKVPLTILSIYK